MAYMYGGDILFINLTEGRISKEPTSSYSGLFLGGRGINIKLLYDGSTPGINPLDPSNLLIFGVGPLCGTSVSASRTEVTAKSPETGFLGSSNFGGQFGPELKFAGYDNIVISGKANKPVYILIHNEQVEIRDASYLWGKDTYETQSIIRAEVDNEVKIACIGQAGENLVHFATIQHDMGHAAGRTGLGAVMGSKNLKAIVARGTKGVILANPEKYLSVAEELHKEMRNHPGLQIVQQEGMARTEDEYRFLLWDPDWKEARSADFPSKYKPKRTGCSGCPVQCMDLYPVEAFGGGVLSCTLYTGPLLVVRNTDVDLMAEFGLLSQRYGIDVVSSTVIIAWLMELYEKGVITAKDTDGIPMDWGTRQAMIDMLRKIVHREGFGDVLADGILPAAERIGRGAQDYAYHVKGLPLYSTYTPKRTIPLKGTALGAAVSSRGDTMRVQVYHELVQMSRFLPMMYNEKTAAELEVAMKEKLKKITGTDKAYLSEEYEGKPELIVFFEDSVIICDCLSACKLASPFMDYPFNEKYHAALFSAGMGVETSVDTLFKFSKRVRNLERAYCVREGMTRDMDSLPKGFMDNPVDRGDFKGSVLETSKFEQMKDRYYTLRGWDIATGIPTRETLEQTGLRDIAQNLEKRGELPEKSPVGQSQTEEEEH